MHRETSIESRYGARLSQARALLDRYFRERQRKGASPLGPGLAVALTDRDGLLAEFAYGVADSSTGQPATTDTLFQIGSITKAILGAVALRLVDKRELDLDAPITHYLDWFEVQSDYGPITVRHVLSHTAGLVSMIDTVPSSRYTTWLLRETKTLFAPGERFHYSNVGYVLLGHVLESAAGVPLVDLVRAEAVEPLGMGDATIAVTHDLYPRIARGHKSGPSDDRPPLPGEPWTPVDWFEVTAGCASFTCAARDLAAFVRMLLNCGETPRGRYLSARSFDALIGRERMREPFDPQYLWGYGLFAGRLEKHAGHTLVWMGGENPGYEAAMIGDLDDGVGAAILVNSFAVPKEETDFTLRVLQALARGDKFPPTPEAAGQPCNPADYAGTYRSEDSEMECIVEGGRLVLCFDGGRVEPIHLWGDTFQVPHPDFALYLLHFGREDGTVVEAHHGCRWFRGGRYSGPSSFEIPKEWTQFLGHYRAFAPLMRTFRVIERKGALLLVWASGYVETPLIDDGDGQFHTEPPSFAWEALRFDCIADGRAQRCIAAGGNIYVRVDTP